MLTIISLSPQLETWTTSYHSQGLGTILGRINLWTSHLILFQSSSSPILNSFAESLLNTLIYLLFLTFYLFLILRMNVSENILF